MQRFSRRQPSPSGFKVHSVVRLSDSPSDAIATTQATQSAYTHEISNSRSESYLGDSLEIPTIVMTPHEQDIQNESEIAYFDSAQRQRASYSSDSSSVSAAMVADFHRLSVNSRYSEDGSMTSDSRRNRFSALFKDKLQLRSRSRGEEDAVASPSGGSLSSPYGRARSNSNTSAGRNRSSSSLIQPGHLSLHLPENLQSITPDEALVARLKVKNDEDKDAEIESESMWESRAVLLARKEGEVDKNSVSSRRSGFADLSQSSVDTLSFVGSANNQQSAQRKVSSGSIAHSAVSDGDLQAAIDLHESGDLEKSTLLFGQLADPEGVNNPLAQVLYGLALRHGWGLRADPDDAIHYFRLAASNSAFIEEAAKKANVKVNPRNRKAGVGGAKGELTLAIFELGNCFRYGWGVEQDAVAAKHYYETAANLGDSDAMTETGKLVFHFLLLCVLMSYQK